MVHLKASSLANAIYVCLMISIFSSCLVLISHYQNVLNDQLQFSGELINTNNSAFQYYVSNTQLFQNGKTQEIEIFDNGISSTAEFKVWGLYWILEVKSYYQNDTITKTALLGIEQPHTKSLALYLTDRDNILNVSGNTSIKGDVKIPKGKVETTYINGTKGNSILMKGSKFDSEKVLPRLLFEIELPEYGPKTVDINNLNPDHNINSFDKETLLLNLNDVPILRNINLKGNFILKSDKSIIIANNSILEDVLLIAPEVTIESGFTGNLQIVAKRLVNIEQDVDLKYPSGIYIKNDTDSVNVKISKNSKLAGGVVLDGDTYIGSLRRKLDIDSLSKIIGTVYCYGSTQLYGEVLGSLYTDKFALQTATSEYENVILSGTINLDSLPKDFVDIGIFQHNQPLRNYGVLKKL